MVKPVMTTAFRGHATLSHSICSPLVGLPPNPEGKPYLPTCGRTMKVLQPFLKSGNQSYDFSGISEGEELQYFRFRIMEKGLQYFSISSFEKQKKCYKISQISKNK